MKSLSSDQHRAEATRLRDAAARRREAAHHADSRGAYQADLQEAIRLERRADEHAAAADAMSGDA